MDTETNWDLVFMSDPHNESKDHADSIKAKGGQPDCKGIVIVGDLTEFGHGPELKKYKDLYEKSSPCTIYPALGNHDYENNINDCARNGCATNMANYLIESVNKLKATKHPEIEFDMRKGKLGKKDEIQGSLDYSWDIGNVHFVHMNNFLDYQTSWTHVDTIFNIHYGSPWALHDLEVARSLNKYIIVMIHQGVKVQEYGYGDYFYTHNVSAIFCGHLHPYPGQKAGKGIGNGSYETIHDVPVYNCGSAQNKDYLYVNFIFNDGDPHMKIWIMKSDSGESRLLDRVKLKRN